MSARVLQLINILTRTTKGREAELEKCKRSIYGQTYKRIRWIVCSDEKNNLIRELHEPHEFFTVESTGVPYNWNFYCNELKERVRDGWFFYLDDDDWLWKPGSLNAIAKHLTNPDVGIICQYRRGIKRKPVFTQDQLMWEENLSHGDWFINPEYIIKGKIGGSAIFLHHSQKNIANWDGERAADYRFIKAVAEKIPLKFVPIPVVQAGNSGRKGL